MNRRQRSRRSSSTQGLNYSNLEPRQLLATLFTGTSAGADIASVTYVDETHVNVQIGDTLTENVDITDGIRIDLLDGYYFTGGYTGDFFTGSSSSSAYIDEITIDHRITGDLQIFNAEKIRVESGDNNWQLAGLPFNYGSASEEVFENSNSEEDSNINSDPQRLSIAINELVGRLNENITFRGFTEICSGDGEDVFNINVTHANSMKVYGGDGGDLFRLNSTSASSYYKGNNIFGEGGNDRFLFYGVAQSKADGGDGYDTVDGSRMTTGMTISVSDLEAGEGGSLGNDKVIGAVGQENFIHSNSDRDLEWFINGKKTTLLDRSTDGSIEFENFFNYKGSSESIDQFWVLRTANELEIFDADWIQIASETDAMSGNLDLIQHDVTISRTLSQAYGTTNYHLSDNDGVLNPTVIMSDATGSGTVSHFGKNQIISRMGGGNVLFGIEPQEPLLSRDATDRSEFAPNLTFHGSVSENDVFIVKETWGETTLHSHGGDDLFMVGSTVADANGELALIEHELDIQAGSGNDRLYANDEGRQAVAFDAADPLPTAYYTLSETNLSRTGLVGDGAEISYNTDLELVRLNGTQNESIRMLVTPSKTTTFAVSGKDTYNENDDVGLTAFTGSEATINESEPGTGSYYFGDQAKVFHFFNLNPSLTDFA